MQTINLQNIKQESVKAIFTAITEHDKISRASISEITGLSLVTVGKIADALLGLDIITQEKVIKQQAGRRAGILSINSEKYSVIFDVTSYDFRYAILELGLKLIEKNRYEYNHSISFNDNLSSFLRETSAYINSRYDNENCYGIGVAVPGPYNAISDTVTTTRVPELESLKIREFVSRFFDNDNFIIESQINAAALSNVSKIENYKEKSIVYWYLGQNYVCGAYLVNGNLILGRDGHACELGRVLNQNDTTLEERMHDATNECECAEIISETLYNIIRILNPHTVIIECDTSFTTDNLSSALTDILVNRYHMNDDEIPEFVKARCKYRNSYRGISMSLRNRWLDKTILNQPSYSDIRKEF